MQEISICIFVMVELTRSRHPFSHTVNAGQEYYYAINLQLRSSASSLGEFRMTVIPVCDCPLKCPHHDPVSGKCARTANQKVSGLALCDECKKAKDTVVVAHYRGPIRAQDSLVDTGSTLSPIPAAHGTIFPDKK
jgi:hypothetical protein